jgi:anionic cell wall polymer biosynthesis LytR-Cps2A-Psr (LCP) family protein
VDLAHVVHARDDHGHVLVLRDEAQGKGRIFQRTARQRRVLTAVLEKCRNLDAATLVKLVDTVLPMITTDMTNIDITGYVVELLPLLPELTIQTQTIPASGAYRLDMIRGMSVVVADFEACRELLEETIGG